MEKRRSMILAGIEEQEQRGSRRVSAETNGNNSCHDEPHAHAHAQLANSRRCSHHSHMSKRSSLASGGVHVGTTQADVLVTLSTSPNNSAHAVDIERRLSQLSDTEVEQVVAVAMEEVSQSGERVEKLLWHGLFELEVT